MGFIVKSMILLVCLFIFYSFMSILHEGSINIFGSTYYTEIGFLAFMVAIFLDTTFSFHKW